MRVGVTQHSGTIQAWEADTITTINGAVCTSSEVGQVHIIAWGKIRARAVEYRGESVILDPSSLIVGMPEQFVIDGQHLTVIKNLDNSIDFYQSPGP